MLRLALLAAAMAVVGCGDDNDTNPPGDSAVPDDGVIISDDMIVVDDAPVTDDAPSNNPDGAVGTECGTETCTTSQECCVEAGGRTCVATGTCAGVALGCDGPEDCTGGEVCCAGGGGGPGSGGTECRNANQCNANVCGSSTDCDGTMCCPIQELGVSLCLAQCP